MGSSGMVFARRQHQRAAFRKRMKTRSRYVNFVLYGIVELKAFFFMFKARRYRYVHEKVVVRCSGCRFSCDVPARHVKGCFPPPGGREAARGSGSGERLKDQPQ